MARVRREEIDVIVGAMLAGSSPATAPSSASTMPQRRPPTLAGTLQLVGLAIVVALGGCVAGIARCASRRGGAAAGGAGDAAEGSEPDGADGEYVPGMYVVQPCSLSSLIHSIAYASELLDLLKARHEFLLLAREIGDRRGEREPVVARRAGVEHVLGVCQRRAVLRRRGAQPVPWRRAALLRLDDGCDIAAASRRDDE